MAAQTTHVKLQQHQPGGDSGHDLLAVQGHVQRALDQLQAQKVQQANIAAGAVSSPLLSNGLRQCFKYKITTDTIYGGGTSDLSFGTKVSDDLGLVSSGRITPVASGLVRLHVQVMFGPHGLGASFNSGYRSQLYVVDSNGSVVHATKWQFATLAESGSAYDLVADLDTQMEMTKGLSYTIRAKVLDSSNNPFSSLTQRAESLAASPYLTGSHFELMPTPGS